MNQIINAMCELFSRFSDPQHPSLREPPFRGHVRKGTGVATHRRSDSPALVLFSFMAPINQGTPYEDAKLVRVKFDMEQLNANPKEYIQGSVAQVQKGIALFAKHAQDEHEDDKVIQLR